MKKNGKKYRKIQKEREYRNRINNRWKEFNEEVEGINIGNFSMSHIITHNPVLYERDETKKEYISRLKSYLKAGGWNRRKFESAELKAYQKIMSEEYDGKSNRGIEYYRYFLVLDLIHILSYDLTEKDLERMERVKKIYFKDFPASNRSVVNSIVRSFSDGKSKFDSLIQNKKLLDEKAYIKLMRTNYLFREKKPVSVMVTATMSAGKSTFINAITGKQICLSQNMACTSKIHCIVNKAYEDGFSYEYDHDLVLTADKEDLFHDNELNTSDKIIVGTHFDGWLKKNRIILNDSPGVNYSGDAEHKEIADKMIKKRTYRLLIYIMNATQLATNDEDEHLDYVKKVIGRTPILFVVNKIDTFNPEEEDVDAIIHRLVEYLKNKGFKNPLVCPVSSRAGYLAKKFRNGRLSKAEQRELYNYVDKFDQMNLTLYYSKNFSRISVADYNSEEEQLLKTSGLDYVEKIIVKLTTGGKKNGAGIC